MKVPAGEAILHSKKYGHSLRPEHIKNKHGKNRKDDREGKCDWKVLNKKIRNEIGRDMKHEAVEHDTECEQDLRCLRKSK